MAKITKSISQNSTKVIALINTYLRIFENAEITPLQRGEKKKRIIS